MISTTLRLNPWEKHQLCRWRNSMAKSHLSEMTLPGQYGNFGLKLAEILKTRCKRGVRTALLTEMSLVGPMEVISNASCQHQSKPKPPKFDFFPSWIFASLHRIPAKKTWANSSSRQRFPPPYTVLTKQFFYPHILNIFKSIHILP